MIEQIKILVGYISPKIIEEVDEHLVSGFQVCHVLLISN